MPTDDTHLFEKGFCCAVSEAIAIGAIGRGTAWGLLDHLVNGDSFDPAILVEWGIDEFDAETIRSADVD